MHDITVYFKYCKPLYIQLDDNSVAREWKKLFQKNLEHSLPMYKKHHDSLPYLKMLIYKLYSKYKEFFNIKNTRKKLPESEDQIYQRIQQLIAEANTLLHWNFPIQLDTIDDAVNLHKSIEEICKDGFVSIPAEYDYIIHDIHSILHTLEANGRFSKNNEIPPHDEILTLEWYNDDQIALDVNFHHKLNLEVGDIKLQFPYVGHPPLQAYRTNDYSRIHQTCKFHNVIRPGLTIVTNVHNRNNFSLSHYIKWWYNNAPDYVSKHGLETILNYTGHPVIGRVLNTEAIKFCTKSTLEKVIVT